MPDDKALDTFVKAFDENDAEHAFENDPFWGRLAKNWEKQSQEWLENLFHRNKKAANPTDVIPSTLAQSAFVSPKEETPLFTVTAEKKPFWKKTKNLFSDIDFGIEDWDLLMEYTKGNTDYDFLLGEHIEFRTIKRYDNGVKRRVNIGYNTRNGKYRIKYHTENQVDAKSAEIFTKEDNIGASLEYNNKINHWYINGSADKYNAAVSFGIKKKLTPEHTVNIGAFTNINYTQKENRVVGVHCRVLFNGR